MKITKIMMGMPITIEVADENMTDEIMNAVFAYFTYVDEKFSTYKETSEISKINKGEVTADGYSEDMNLILSLAGETKKTTGGYFDIKRADGNCDPSGIVKGWAIFNAAKILSDRGMKNFYVNVAGDVQVSGKNKDGENWKIGIQNPFNKKQEIIKVLQLTNEGVATSGSYVRGNHIYNPKQSGETIKDIVSMTVVGPNIYEADRFATASFAMGKDGIKFIESLDGFEGYMIDSHGIATMTSGFGGYTL